MADGQRLRAIDSLPLVPLVRHLRRRLANLRQEAVFLAAASKAALGLLPSRGHRPTLASGSVPNLLGRLLAAPLRLDRELKMKRRGGEKG